MPRLEDMQNNPDYMAGFEAAKEQFGFRWQREQSVQTQVALLSQTIENLKIEMTDINNSIKELRTDIKNINDMANKYRGGLLVVLALGGVIGTLITLSDKIVHWFK